MAATLRDTRPLAVGGQPEVREYRARFLDGTEEISGDGSPVEGVTVSVWGEVGNRFLFPAPTTDFISAVALIH